MHAQVATTQNLIISCFHISRLIISLYVNYTLATAYSHEVCLDSNVLISFYACITIDSHFLQHNAVLVQIVKGLRFHRDNFIILKVTYSS